MASSSSNAASLPPVLMNAWRYDQRDIHNLSDQLSGNGWTVSSLAEAHLKTQLKSYDLLMEEERMQTKNYMKAPSLASLSAGKIIEMLEESDNLTADVRTIAKNLNANTLRDVLEDPRTPYPVLRAFLALPPGYGPGNAAETARTLVDIDEAILANERYIRSRGAEQNKDGKGLVNLDNASMLFDPSTSGAVDESLTITRKDPPKGGFEILNEKRDRTVRIQPNSKAFVETFHRITRNILHGLDWSNVFLAGGAALTTLMHTDPSKDDDRDVKDNDLDIYIYGLRPKEANEKVKHIYQVWKSNLPADNKQQLVVKNSKTINLLADYPNRRIQIVLKLVQSPTQVLLNFDLDACALGFNGKEVLMLPRCARALETGYSTFTMDLIWGHHLGDRRATQEIRVFKYADRGFGLRILPSYVQSIEESESRQTKLAGLPTAQQDGADVDGTIDGESQETVRPLIAHSSYVWGLRDRKPNGAEPGLKTLKRMAFMGQNFVHAYYFGAAPLSKCPDWEDEESWRQEFEDTKAENDRIFAANERRRAAGEACEGPVISLNTMDTRDMHFGLPGGRRGLGGFELFMRHCEVWRLHARADATLDPESFSSTVYDPDGYDDVPEYQWDKNFNAMTFARAIDTHNNSLFENLKHIICHELNIEYQRTGWRDYLTRRIRRQVDGPDVDSVFEKQITMPVIIPYDLEQSLVQIMSEALGEAGLSEGQLDQFLIPVHELGKGTAIIPDLQDSAGPTGNVRMWVIGNELMWAGIDRRIDEVFEILWTLFHWHNSATADQYYTRLDHGDALVHLASSFRQRLPPPLDVSTSEISEELQESRKEHPPAYLRSAKWKGLSPREAVLFKRWAFHNPKLVNRTYNDYDRHSMFGEEEDMLYPFPDDLFWKDGDEGDSGRDGVPQWQDVGSTEGEHKDAQKEKDVGSTDDEHQIAQNEKEEGRKRKRESSGLSQNLVVHEK